MSYKIVETDNKFAILEVTTNQIIVNCEKYSSAKKFLNRFKSGCGFRGNTPPFFLKKLYIREKK